MEFTCQDALPLIPSYLDGELSEVRAGMLRKHLLDCHACRNEAQEGKALSRWFVAPERSQLAVPSGFAARVARRAFAGDRGSLEPAGAAPQEGGRLLQFVLSLTAAAAAVMLISAVALRDRDLPHAGSLNAATPPPPVEELLLQLDELNRKESATAGSSETAGRAGAPVVPVTHGQ